MNCAAATLQAFQDVFGLRDDLLLKSVTGLEGGVVAGGSTCGVITGGALGLAQLWRERIGADPSASESLMKMVADYVGWFLENVGTTLCRERTGVDFHTGRGLARYFIPGDRVIRCMSHIGKALRFLETTAGHGPLPSRSGRDDCEAPLHCASAVLATLRERTGLGHVRIERTAAVLSGGVGLSGGVCGALAGAIMGVNLLVGMDVRQSGRVRIMRDFAVGHINLLIREPRWMPEPFGIGREIVRRFREEAGSTLCRRIAGRDVTDIADLSAHLSASRTCRSMIHLSSDLATEAVRRWR
jgi:C_GCAxxG_C_C family probable redox protein